MHSILALPFRRRRKRIEFLSMHARKYDFSFDPGAKKLWDQPLTEKLIIFAIEKESDIEFCGVKCSTE